MIGGQIAHYRIEAKLGEGGIGKVSSEEYTSLQRKLALEFLPCLWSRRPSASDSSGKRDLWSNGLERARKLDSVFTQSLLNPFVDGYKSLSSPICCVIHRSDKGDILL